MTDLATYLAGLKVGDVVTVNTTEHHVPNYYDAAVTKITPTQIATTNGRFMKATGGKIGYHGWNCPAIVLPEDAPSLKSRTRRRLIMSEVYALARKTERPTQNFANRLRTIADEAEALLREAGEWTDE